jgi:hypothetical protein
MIKGTRLKVKGTDNKVKGRRTGYWEKILIKNI